MTKQDISHICSQIQKPIKRKVQIQSCLTNLKKKASPLTYLNFTLLIGSLANLIFIFLKIENIVGKL